MSQNADGPKPEKVVYDQLSGAGCEDTQGYNFGGFHPIHLGDVLNDRFEVSHKLGNGGFGTVWLCWDQKKSAWKAVKVMAADHSINSNESRIFRHLLNGASFEELERNHIGIHEEEFWVEGPNGRHICYVLPLYGSTVTDWKLFCTKWADDKARKDVKEVCRQVAAGMQYLHSRGICHGDFRPGNILMKLKSLDHLSRDQVLELMEDPETIEVEARGGADPRAHGPDYCVIPVNEDKNWCEELMIPEIVIVDFGESYFIGKPPKRLGIPFDNAAPEVMFNFNETLSFGPGTDTWALGTTIFDIWHGPLFGEIRLPRLIQSLERYAGPLPKNYRIAYQSEFPHSEGDRYVVDDMSRPFSQTVEEVEECRQFLTKDTGYTTLLQGKLARRINALKGRAQHLPTIEELKASPNYLAERYHILMLSDLLEKVFQYDPAKRPDARSVARHPFLKDTVRIPLSYWTRQHKYYKLAQRRIQQVAQVKNYLPIGNPDMLLPMWIAIWLGFMAIMVAILATRFSTKELAHTFTLGDALPGNLGFCKCACRSP